MDSNAHLAGIAQQMFLEFYVFRGSSSPDLPLLRFMYTSKSGRSAVQKYFHNMTLSQSGVGGFVFTAERSDAFFKEIVVKEELAINMLEFLRPHISKISIGSEADAKQLEKIKPFVETTNKLELDNTDAVVIPFVQYIAPKITELTCTIETLTLPDFPSMDLQKFKLQCNIFEEHVNLAPLFQYNIKHVDLTGIINDYVLANANLGDDEHKNNTIEHLDLKISNSKTCDKLLPFIKKFLQHAPNLQNINLTIEATSSNLDGTWFVSQLVEIYDDIMSFKEQTTDFLKKLSVTFSGDTFVVETDIYNSDWVDALRSNPKFKDATFTATQWNNEEVIELTDFQNNGSSIFSLCFKATLSVVNEDDYQQVLEDNFDLELDDSEISYDYSDMSDFDM